MISTHELAIMANEPRLADWMLARSLGLSRADFGTLVEHHADELTGYASLYVVGRLLRPDRRGRGKSEAEERTYWLTEEQALLISVLCRKPEAVRVRYSIIVAFRQWRLSEHAAVVNYFKRRERAERSRSAPTSAA